MLFSYDAPSGSMPSSKVGGPQREQIKVQGVITQTECVYNLSEFSMSPCWPERPQWEREWGCGVSSIWPKAHRRCDEMRVNPIKAMTGRWTSGRTWRTISHPRSMCHEQEVPLCDRGCKESKRRATQWGRPAGHTHGHWQVPLKRSLPTSTLESLCVTFPEGMLNVLFNVSCFLSRFL